jgi:L-lactate utilization protein LutC
MSSESSRPDIQRFLLAWSGWGGTHELHANPTSARLGLLRFLRDLQVREVLAWPAPQLPLSGLDDALRDAGFVLVEADRQAPRTGLETGLTGADAGLIDTGSLVFEPGPGRSWLPALLPWRHIVILPAHRLQPSLAAWRRQQSGREQETGGALIVTGPSISADIEFHRHRGAFGPRFLHLLLVDGLGE